MRERVGDRGRRERRRRRRSLCRNEIQKTENQICLQGRKTIQVKH